MFKKFFDANRKICDRIEPYLPQTKVNIFELYERIVAEHMNSRANQIVVDVGGGKSCKFAKYRDPVAKAKIIALDLSEEELKYNVDVDDKRVVDVVRDLPFEAEEVDLIVSRSVLEHLKNVENFVANARRVLKKGGYFIHLFPSRFAPFALLNQALPPSIAREVLYYLQPESRGICGFSAFYEHCSYSGINRLLQKHGFELVDVHLGYYQSQYFNFFVPLFLVSALYEILIRALRAKNFAAYILIIARRK